MVVFYKTYYTKIYINYKLILMNKVIMQLWEESERGWGVRPDGCSLHMDSIIKNVFIDSIYKSRTDKAPNEYDRITGGEINAFVDDQLFDIIKSKGSIRLLEHELNNLISMQEIIIKS